MRPQRATPKKPGQCKECKPLRPRRHPIHASLGRGILDAMTTPETPAEKLAPQTREATFTLKRAAEVAGVSPSTLRRHKELLRGHGATISENGWQVPMSALVASGLMRRTTPPDEPEQASRGMEVATEHLVQERLRELEREAVELRHRAELAEERQRAAEAVARERGEALEDARMAMRMLTAAPSAPANPQEDATGTVALEKPAPAPENVPMPRKNSWLQRLRG